LLGRPVTQPLSFDVPMDLSSPRSASFVRALQLLHGEVQRPDGMTADPAMAAGMTRLVMTGLLLAQPHNYTDQLHDPTRSVAPATIRNAIEFIEAEPEQVMTVSDVAAVACLSVRALEDGFRRHVGVSPMTYVRDIRLARVHLELSTVDPETTTAAAVARRWGFNHYSRFAALYRERYSVAPAKTLAGRGGDR
jgi:transcriptional regulator GlxA family with amidase domain